MSKTKPPDPRRSNVSVRANPDRHYWRQRRAHNAKIKLMWEKVSGRNYPQ